MTPRKHAALARALCKACGGFEEAATACRLGKTALSNAATVHKNYFLPIDVIADLEIYCGRPIYSRGLVDAVPLGADGDIVADAIELTQKSAALNAQLHQAMKNGGLSPNEMTALHREVLVLRSALGAFEAELGSTEISSAGATGS